ncbi:MAG TPA: DUF309 domain-containing protein [Vicinamibacteria bacterium]
MRPAPERPEPQLDAEERRALARGIDEFNRGLFFECHDTLEEMWAGVRGPSRDFFQGLIQVAVAFYHLTGGNHAGAASMLARALKRFAPYPDRYAGFDLAAHREELRAWQARVAGEAPLDETPGLPRWRFENLGE